MSERKAHDDCVTSSVLGQERHLEPAGEREALGAGLDVLQRRVERLTLGDGLASRVVRYQGLDIGRRREAPLPVRAPIRV